MIARTNSGRGRFFVPGGFVMRCWGYKLNSAFKVTALRVLMSCKREQFEFLEREAKAKHGEKICDEMFDYLYAKVREYAQQRRLEELTRKSKGDPMDVGQLK